MNIKKYIKNSPKKIRGKKSGTTLVELIAVVAILAFISTSCVSAMFGMANIAKEGQRISEAERTCAILNDEFSIYGNTATWVESYTSMPSLVAYNSTSALSGFKDGTSATDKLFVDYFICADENTDNTIIFKKFVSGSGSVNTTETITRVDGIDKVTFRLKKLELNTSSADYRYLLEYDINTNNKFAITSGVVLNNTSKDIVLPTMGGVDDSFTIYAKGSEEYNDGTMGSAGKNSTNTLRIRTTNRELSEMPEAEVIAAGPIVSGSSSSSSSIYIPPISPSSSSVSSGSSSSSGGGSSSSSTGGSSSSSTGGSSSSSTSASSSSSGGGGGGGSSSVSSSSTSSGGAASVINGASSSDVSGTIKMTFTDNKKWGSVYCHYWGDDASLNTSWPGKSMTKVSTNEFGEDVYELTIPKNVNYVVFNNGDNGKQTVDIPINTSAKYYISGESGGKFTVATWN